MKSGDPDYSLNVVSPLDTNLESIVIYETSWIDAIVQDDVKQARQLRIHFVEYRHCHFHFSM